MELLVVVFIILGIIGLFVIGYILFRRMLYNIIDKRIERFQSELIEKQVREIQNMYRQVRGWRHDYRNHIQNMKIQLAEKNYGKLDSYLSELAEDLAAVDTVIKTGNVMADAILNSKLRSAENLNVSLSVKASIPEKLAMSDVELCTVMGNLLDNAIEACAALSEEERFMRIYIGQFKKQFYISVQNSAGKIKKQNGRYLSTKDGEHGYGLFRIDRIAKKYSGYVNRQNEDGIFATEIMLPMNNVQ